MKLFSAIATFSLIASTSAFATEVYTCNSNDFKPAVNEGQSLTVMVNAGHISEIRKNKGSYYSEGGVVVHPKMIEVRANSTVYRCDFRDDSFNGRLVVGNLNHLTTARFTFADSEAGVYAYALACKLNK